MATTADALTAMQQTKASIPRVLKRLLAHYEMTAADLAPVLGVTRAAVSARLNGSTVIKSEELAALSVFFEVPVSVFFLTPDEALRYVLDNGPSVDQRIGRNACSAVLAGQAA